MNILGQDPAGFHNFVNLGNHQSGCRGHHGIEITGIPFKVKVSILIGYTCPQECNVH